MTRGATLETVFVVTHTHWDREWYRSAGEFRLGLVDLVDEVLDGKGGGHVLLDGQAIALLDYLEQRPERAADLAQALSSGRIDAGPWFVLGDNLMPSGEALVRNLLAGREVLSRLGGTPPPVLYCPDAFGHPAALPLLAQGFGLPVVVLWRGYGGPPWPAGDVARWRAASGDSVLLYHLPPDGYEFGSNLPTDVQGATERWTRVREVLAPRATLGVALLPNGADHHAVQAGRAEALQRLTEAARPVRIEVASMGAFVATLQGRAAARPLPVVQGELRHSPDYVWSLQGTFGTRAHEKRRNAQAERLLTRDVEPWLALAWWRDGESRDDEGRALWRTLLACHPHDTLCGCSIDAVAQAMEQRLDEVARAGALAGRRARLALLGHDAVTARARADRWRSALVVRNGAPWARAGIAELEVEEVLGVVPVGPASAGATIPRAGGAPVRLGDGTRPVQELSRELVHVREESPRHYPRNLLVRRRRMLAWMEDVPALGLAVLPIARGRARPSEAPHPVHVAPDALDNGRCRVWIDDDRRLCVRYGDGATVVDLLGLEVEGDRGDLYTPSPIPGTRRTARISAHRLTQRGPLRGELRLTMKAVIPARALVTATGEEVRLGATTVTVAVDVRLDASADAPVFVVHGTNTAHDARLRLVIRTGLLPVESWADAAFGDVARALAPSNADAATVHLGRAGEAALPTAPLHRYVSLYDDARGTTLLADGLAEYEARADGSIAVTLVRAVGDLSRLDLPERPGHAGWPVATPAAQCIAPFEGRFALLRHGPRTDAAGDAIARAVDAFLLPMVGESWHSAIEPPAAVAGARLIGDGLTMTACKPSEDGASLVVRCVNRREHAAPGAWALDGVSRAWLARLDETPLAELPVREGRVDFIAPPAAVMTILLRRSDVSWG